MIVRRVEAEVNKECVESAVVVQVVANKDTHTGDNFRPKQNKSRG